MLNAHVGSTSKLHHCRSSGISSDAGGLPVAPVVHRLSCHRLEAGSIRGRRSPRIGSVVDHPYVSHIIPYTMRIFHIYIYAHVYIYIYIFFFFLGLLGLACGGHATFQPSGLVGNQA